MACGGFVCTKNALIALNWLYIVVAVILIAIGGYVKSASIVTSPTVFGFVIAVGVFLLLVALAGLYGSARHHQVYMIVLFCVFIVQFFIAVACLGYVSTTEVSKLVTNGWHRSSNATIYDAEKNFGCCGLESATDMAYDCNSLPCRSKCIDGCLDVISRTTSDNLQLAGVVGLVFSFSEVIGIGLTMRYRNMKDPRANPNRYFS